ncbi:MAG TPA: right-handed parallel beta-helix repeat-containing protein [Caldilineaceae bacterium]|nr:right-handed parallel beta-helix repeat-containing protein [Caldilineaceae bacterium]
MSAIEQPHPTQLPSVVTRAVFATVVVVGAMALLLLPLNVARAQTAPTVTYNSNINTIFIGSDPGVGVVPGSQTISLQALAAALTASGDTGVLASQGNGVWLSTARIEIKASARLEVTQAEDLKELRLESVIGKLAYIRVQDGGHLLIDGIKVTSWDTGANAVDASINDGRAYIVAQEGAQLDVLRSEVAYLGDASSTTASGLAWVKRGNPGDAATGSTGTVQESKIHHNYQGIFVSEGISLTISTNDIYSNRNNGVWVRDNARAITIVGNTVRENGDQSTANGDGIIIYDGSVQNTIRNNKVHTNAGDGIVLERNSNNNTVAGNEVYQNGDGIVIADADNNVVQNNTAHDNRNGIRLSGSQDNPTAGNQILNNTVRDSKSTNGNAYGIYLYNHADSNLIRGNTILRSATYGIYIKSGGNWVESNTIRDGKTGLAIVGEAESIGQIPQLVLAGTNNVVISTTVTGNSDIGIRIEGGVHNGIGADPATGAPLGPNNVSGNGGNGIFIKNTSSGYSSTDNYVIENTIHTNGSAGIVVKDAGSDRNRLSRNSVTENAGSGIKIDGGANGGIQPPVIEDILADGIARGTAAPNATVELYTDPGSEGETLLGVVATNDSGEWSFQLPPNQDPKRVTALVIAANGNTSAFSGASGSSVELFTTVSTDEQGQALINLNGPGAFATLADIQSLLGSANAGLLQNQGNGVWQLNASIKLEREVTLNLSPDTGVTELKLRSNAGAVPNAVDYNSFVYIRTHNGIININGVKIYGWDEAANTFDTNIADGRAFIIAKYGAELNIRNAEISYLGTSDSSESGGVTWRDDTAISAAGTMRTQVTGVVENSLFHHNFNGVQVIQAGDMTFMGNEFHDNNNYGFYARDNSRDIVLENNLVYNNASHGIHLARGCTNFTLRSNKAYNNGGGGFAHGILISQGSAPTAPSVENLLEGNEAYGNGGYGINIEGSNNNTVRNNNLHDNQVGVTIEDGSRANQILNNSTASNTNHGIQTRQGSNANTIMGNTAADNNANGIYIRSSNNRVEDNSATRNLEVGIAVRPESGAALESNQLISNSVTSNAGSGVDIRSATGTTVDHNYIAGNGIHGLYLTDGAVDTVVSNNTIALNNDTGIRVNSALSYQNRWTANAIYDNKAAGIYLAGGANNSVRRPKLDPIEGRYVTGRVNSPGATVELYSDTGLQGQYFLGSGVAGDKGDFSIFVVGSFKASNVVAVATDTQGNSSEFSDVAAVANINPDVLIFLPVVSND